MSNNVIYKSLSFTDLENAGLTIDVTETENDPKIANIWHQGNKMTLNELMKVLWQIGIINDEHLHVQPKCEHVMSNGKRTENYRLLGQERKDRNWLNSGSASDEARMGSSKMRDMGHQASRLANGGDR